MTSSGRSSPRPLEGDRSKKVEVKVIVDPVDRRRRRRQGRRHRHRRQREAPSRTVEGAGERLVAETSRSGRRTSTSALEAQHVDRISSRRLEREEVVASTRSATESRASPDYRASWRTRCSSFRAASSDSAMNLEEDMIGAVVLGEAITSRRGARSSRPARDPLGRGRRRSVGPGRRRPR